MAPRENLKRSGNEGLSGRLGGSTTRNCAPCCCRSRLVANADSCFLANSSVYSFFMLPRVAHHVAHLGFDRRSGIQPSLVNLRRLLQSLDLLARLLDLHLVDLHLALQLHQRRHGLQSARARVVGLDVFLRLGGHVLLQLLQAGNAFPSASSHPDGRRCIALPCRPDEVRALSSSLSMLLGTPAESLID